MGDKRVVILGNGVAGVSCARHIRKRSELPVTIISSESKHFFSRTALMYIYMGHMKYEHTKPYPDHFWEKNRIELIQARVDDIDPESRLLRLESGEQINYEQLVLATGSQTATYGWKGLDLKGVQGLYSLQDLQQMEVNTDGIESAVVVGGGLIGVEMAEMLISRGIKVTLLVREDRFWGIILPKEEGELIDEHLRKEGVELLLETELEQILGDEEGKVKAVNTKDGKLIDCQFVGICTGVKPNVSFLKDSNLEIDRGLLVDQYLRTNLDNVYAIGDCAQLRRPPAHRKEIEAVWYVAKMMGEVAAANICGVPTRYNPGPWFNSAKFFHIEYQTYGKVPAIPHDDLSSLYWEDKKNEKALRLVYDNETHQLVGIHAFGIRLHHPTCEYWLKSEIDINQLINELEKANFDPEFYQSSFPNIKSSMKEQLITSQL